MSVFSLKNQLNQSNVEVATKQDTIVDTMSLPVKDISYKNPSGPEVQVMDYNTILALQGVAFDNADKNSTQDGLISGLESSKQDTIGENTALMVKDVSYKNPTGPEVQTMDYNTIVALQDLAVSNAAKNLSDDALLAGLESDKQNLIVDSSVLTFTETIYNNKDTTAGGVRAFGYSEVEAIESALTSISDNVSANESFIISSFNKRMMLVCGEFSGVLVPGSVSQFSFGSGSTSNTARAGYGVPIPFNFDLMRVMMVVDTVSTDLVATFNIVWYAFGSTVGTQLGSFVLDVTGFNYIRWMATALDNSDGNICIECASYTGTSEPDAEFRISLALQCDTEFS